MFEGVGTAADHIGRIKKFDPAPSFRFFPEPEAEYNLRFHALHKKIVPALPGSRLAIRILAAWQTSGRNPLSCIEIPTISKHQIGWCKRRHGNLTTSKPVPMGLPGSTC